MVTRPPIRVVGGMPILGPFAENWENVQRFQAKDGDLVIVTFPKSGTTWMSEILDLMIHNGDVTKTQRGAIFERVPFLEYAVPDMPYGTEIINAMESPRVMKSHLPVHLLPSSFWEKKCKIIYMARNPKDVLVSYYHFYRMAVVHPHPGTLENFLQMFIDGKVAFGSWSDHVTGWWKIRRQKDILYLFYEDLLEDPKREIRKVMEFIGKDLSEDVLEKIHQRTTFKTMKENQMANYSTIPISVMDHSISPFMRKAPLSWAPPRGADMSQRPPLEIVGGMPIIGHFAKNWENVQSFQFGEGDLLIDTYPKSGTTWMSQIVDLILHHEDQKRSSPGAIFERVPFLEFAVPDMPTGTELLNVRKPPRLIKSHLPVHLLPDSFWEKNCKVIYVARNPKDVLVSFYYFYHMAIVHPDPGTFQEFLQKFIEGEVSYGSWGDHVIGWWRIRQQRDILYLFYEDMLEDPKREIRKVMKFLGKDLAEDVVEKIHLCTTFKAMKEDDTANYSTIPRSVMDHNISPFMRKGTRGDWRNHLTVAQNELFDEYFKRKMSDTDLTFRF